MFWPFSFLSESKGSCQCTLHHNMYDKHYKNSILQTSKEYYEDLTLSQQRIDSSTLCCRKKLPTQNNGPFGKNGKLWIGNYWAPKTSETTKKLFINNSTTDQICFGHKNQPFWLVRGALTLVLALLLSVVFNFHPGLQIPFSMFRAKHASPKKAHLQMPSD